MTAGELIAAAGNCLICGQPHEYRRVPDGRGNMTSTRYQDGHFPQPLDPNIAVRLTALAAVTPTPGQPATITPKRAATRRKASQ